VTQAEAILPGPEPDGTGCEGASELTKALDRLLDPLDDVSAAARTGSSAAAADDQGREALSHVSSGLDEAWNAQKPALRGKNVYAAIRLSKFEAEAGTRRVISFTLTEMCSNCGGNGMTHMPDPNCETCAGGRLLRERSRGKTGRVPPLENCRQCGGAPCANCEGAGGVEAKHRLRLLIPPGLEDGSQLVVAGEGSVPEGIGVPGDLLVLVHVLREPKGSQVGRYVGLALLVATLALLAYLLQH
jgi:molecular chaperone DnaJ